MSRQLAPVFAWLILIAVVAASGCTGYIAKESASAEDFQSQDVPDDNQSLDVTINASGNETTQSAAENEVKEETEQTPVQQTQDLCANKNCGSTSMTCPDSYIASCSNTCNNGTCVSCTPDCTGHELNHVIFSEVMYDTVSSGDKDEWLELYNPLGADISLSGWTISDNSGTWTFSDITINRKFYLVIAKNATAFMSGFNCLPHVSGFTRPLNNDGDQLALKNAGGSEVDFVAWEKGASDVYPAWDITAKQGKSLARIKLTEDSDSATDWQESDPKPDC